MPNLASFRATSFDVPPLPDKLQLQHLSARDPPTMASPPPTTVSRRFPADDHVELAPGDYSGKLPVDIMTMPVVPCPLIKLGNRVIICGRYSDNEPCVKAANSLGVLMLSSTYTNCKPPAAITRRDSFIADWKAFHYEMYGLVPRLPTVSGSKLDLFLFAEQVLLLGGIDTVIEKRGFVVLAKQLCLSKPCTSAAVVLRRAHQSLMHQYEQRLIQLSTATPDQTYLHSHPRVAHQLPAEHPNEPTPTLPSFPYLPQNALHDPYHRHPTNPTNKMRRISESDSDSNDHYYQTSASPRKKMRRISDPPALSSAFPKSSTSLALSLNPQSNVAAPPQLSYDNRSAPLPGPAQINRLSYPPRDGARAVLSARVLEVTSERTQLLNTNTVAETGASLANLSNDTGSVGVAHFANQGPAP
ncbi:AT-rich interactive domain-containing protein cfi-1 [Gracilariopsis chorda]|uniref:AT-rich interactive domain-containing protein cfi-1 n=1 Tax=Gracilariopsis chorda TaxID=448386 RepID=A0A2V3IYD2_9FLOR|nr:AT-rich interactive domain-containing protein cfi-1 [Gracilariopsis chorda]|eukprot:PXF47073.1 AT-rich interactive domain-containing protein cfi-1 [Gracilariopsis chorda]